MSTLIKDVKIDSTGLQQMIVNSFNLMISEKYDFVKVPLGLAGTNVISIVIEPLYQDNNQTVKGGVEIPYHDRDECLGKMNDTVTLILKQHKVGDVFIKL